MKTILVCLIFGLLSSAAHAEESSPFQKECERAISRFAENSDVDFLRPLCPLIQNESALKCLQFSVGIDTPTTSLMMACRRIENAEQVAKIQATRDAYQSRFFGVNDTISTAEINKIAETK